MCKGGVGNDSAREENLENFLSWEAPAINQVALHELALHVQSALCNEYFLSMSSHIFIDGYMV